MAPARKRKAAIAAAIAIKREPGVEVKQELAAEQKPAVRIKTEEIKNTNRQLEGDTKREAGHTKQNGAGSAAPRARDSAVKAEAAVKIKDWTTTAAASIKQDKFNSAQSPARRHKQPQPLGPFPDMMRPLEEECLAARDSLAALHGMPEVEEVKDSAESKVPAGAALPGDGVSFTDPQQRTVLDSLVRTILSQNTTDTTSKRAFLQLKAGFPTWTSVQSAGEGAVEDAIRCGGLADVKVLRIREILATLQAERGELSLEYVRSLDDVEIKEELSRFKGVGPKTVACVLMFCLHRKEFPVDTHVWRITKSLGWVPPKATREQAYEHLNLRVPDELKYTLHVLLVRHGKQCPRCAKGGKPRFPSEGPCPLMPGMLKGGGIASSTGREANQAGNGCEPACADETFTAGGRTKVKPEESA